MYEEDGVVGGEDACAYVVYDGGQGLAGIDRLQEDALRLGHHAYRLYALRAGVRVAGAYVVAGLDNVVLLQGHGKLQALGGGVGPTQDVGEVEGGVGDQDAGDVPGQAQGLGRSRIPTRRNF